jgi:hypothetical protein
MLMSWNSDLICYADVTHPIGWRDHLRWWNEGWLGVIFHWAYKGSDEELNAVDHDEIPVRYMNTRQRAYFNSLNVSRLPRPNAVKELEERLCSMYISKYN